MSTVVGMKHPAVGVAGLTAATVIVVDQLTKVWAVATLEGQPDRQIIGDLLRFSFVRNPGPPSVSAAAPRSFSASWPLRWPSS